MLWFSAKFLVSKYFAVIFSNALPLMAVEQFRLVRVAAFGFFVDFLTPLITQAPLFTIIAFDALGQ